METPVQPTQLPHQPPVTQSATQAPPAPTAAPSMSSAPPVSPPSTERKRNLPLILSFAGLLVLILIGVGIWLYQNLIKASSNKTKGDHMDVTAIQNQANGAASYADLQQKLLGGTDQEKLAVANDLAKDASTAEPTTLYSAATIALQNGDSKSAGFLFYAAQLRKNFDAERFQLAEPDGNNVMTTLSALNQTAGQSINPAVSRDPEVYNFVMDKIKSWQVIPAEGTYYPPEYGQPVLPKSEWQVTADTLKQDFFTKLADPLGKIVNDPELHKKYLFVQDYNFGKIERTDENTKLFEEYGAEIKKILSITE